MDLPVFPDLTVEVVNDVPRDNDHKSSKFDGDFGGAAGEAFEGRAAGVIGAADIDVRTDVVGDSGVDVDHKLPDDPPTVGENCLFVGESALTEVLANAAGLGTCDPSDEFIMGPRLAGGLVLRSISINVGLVGRGAGVGAGEDGAGEDGAAWKSAKSSSSRLTLPTDGRALFVLDTRLTLVAATGSSPKLPRRSTSGSFGFGGAGCAGRTGELTDCVP
jgi:hypothetical protein